MSNWLDNFFSAKEVSKHPDNPENSENLKKTNIRKSEKSENNKKILFFATIEGMAENIPYTYKELKNIFRQNIDDDSVRFYHESKKLGEGELTFLIDTGKAQGEQKKLLFDD